LPTRFEFAINARRFLVRAEHADRPARLHEQRLIVLEPAQLSHDRVIVVPAARRFAGAAVDDEILWPFRDVGIEVVHQHAQRRFLRPALARQLRAVWRPDRFGHGVVVPQSREMIEWAAVLSWSALRDDRSSRS
jgi:hypothetical protein